MRPGLMTSLACAAALVLAGGCEREQRRFHTPPGPPGGVGAVRTSSLHVGPAASAASAAAPDAGSSVAAASAASDPLSGVNAFMRPATANPHEENAFAVAQGKRLFRSYNCSGCHSNGGGGMGPALMDDKWIYGSDAAQIVQTILQGRPNGMPSFAGRVPEDQAWQIAAYVRSMSGQLRTDVAPGRSDSLSSGPPEGRRDKLAPKPSGEPPNQ